MQDAKRVFLDSNIVLYALGIDAKKRNIAWELLLSMPYISLQVLNECSNVLLRKQQWSMPKTAETLERILCFTKIEASNLATVRLAWKIQARYQFSYYDSLIIAAALAAGCDKLYSEDMHHGQIIENCLTIINPFS